MFCFLKPSSPERQTACYYCAEPVHKNFRGRGLCAEHYSAYTMAAGLLVAGHQASHTVTWEEIESRVKDETIKF